MADAANVFISHASVDSGIADALSRAMEAIFGKRVSVSYSTKSTDGGIPTGADWFRWIGEQVEDSEVTVVLLTPRFIESDWLLWETGAVYGAALGAGAGKRPRVRPLSYAVDPDGLPEPLRAANLQVTPGESVPEMRQFMKTLIQDLHVLQGQEAVDAGATLARTVNAYIREVQRCLDAPRFQGPPADTETLQKLLTLTTGAIRALAPSVMMNGRYFYAATESGRKLLVRHDDIYCEAVPMPKEFGFESVDLERDADTMVICKSYLERTPLYEVLDPGLTARYDPAIRAGIDPSQGWVLACPVLVKGSAPLGVICLYGDKPPARNAAQSRNLLAVATDLSELFSNVIAG